MNLKTPKLFASCICLLLLFGSCKEKPVDKEASDISKAVELIDGNKAINAKLLKFRKELGAKFMLCYVITNKKHMVLEFQILQSDSIKCPPLSIDGLYKIRNVQGVDVYVESSEMDRSKKYKIEIENDAKDLIKRGYLTIKGRPFSIQGGSVDFVFCKNDDNVFTELTFEFLSREEQKSRDKNEPFHEEKFYPKCD